MDLRKSLTLVRQNDKEDSRQLIGLQLEVAVCSLLGAVEGVPNIFCAGIRVDNKLRRDAAARVKASWQLHAIVAACRQLIGKEGLHTSHSDASGTLRSPAGKPGSMEVPCLKKPPWICMMSESSKNSVKNCHAVRRRLFCPDEHGRRYDITS